MREFWERIRFYFLRDVCPFCDRLCFAGWHRCEVVAGMSNDQAVRAVTAKIREILADEPADRFVHEAFAGMEQLEEAFPVASRVSAEGAGQKDSTRMKP